MHLTYMEHRNNTQLSPSLFVKNMTHYTQFLNNRIRRCILATCLALLGSLALSFTSYGTLSIQAHDDAYVVQPGDTLSEIAKQYGYTVSQFMSENSLDDPNFIWVGQELHLPGSSYDSNNTSSTPSAESTTAIYSSVPMVDPVQESLIATGRRWIEVDISEQLLTAWEGDSPIMSSVISGGAEETPTVLGRFYVDRRLDSQHMRGADFDYPGVPWVMYFHGAYAIHGAYWHDVFGTPRSHGCVNMTPSDAQWLYNWSSYGTEVYIHE